MINLDVLRRFEKDRQGSEELCKALDEAVKWIKEGGRARSDS